MKALTGFFLSGLSLAMAAASSLAAQGVGKQLSLANAALQAGEADKALALLNPLAQPGGPAEAYNLRCRVEYTLEQWNQAVGDCEQAVKLDAQSLDAHLWLGRVLGEKARRASVLSAYSLAKQVRTECEEAARLNPRNAEALAALGEFYYSAPGVVGGGVSKSDMVAEELDRIAPMRALDLRARIAGQRKDYGAAERDLKKAIAISAHPAFQWMALASFYRERQRWKEMESAVRSGEHAAQRDRQAGVGLYYGASMLIATNRDPTRAANLLEAYLASSSKTEDAPAFVAHFWLARLKAQLGDAAAAGRERAAALALAHEYKPAQDLKY